MIVDSTKGIGRQDQNRKHRLSSTRPHLGAPPNAEKQRDFVLRLLRQAGNHGINRDHFLSGSGPCAGRRCTQVGARLDELTKEGFIFESKMLSGDRFVTYYLKHEPIEPRKPALQVSKYRHAGGWRPIQYGKNAQPWPSEPAQKQSALFDMGPAKSGNLFVDVETGRRAG